MLLLTSTSDILRVVTSAAANCQAHVSWVDNLSGAITPGRTNTAAIVTATTTTILAAPAASTQRAVKHINITNTSGSVSTQVTVQHFDGTTSVDLFGVTLLPGENLVLDEDASWHHHDAQGADYAYNGAQFTCPLGIQGCVAETMPRELCPEVNTAALTSGTLRLDAVFLQAGQLVSNISYFSATTAVATPTNGFFALYDGLRNKLAESANFTTEAWAANTIKTKAMTTPYRVPTTGVYYIGIMIAATTVPTLKGGTAKTGGQLAATAPILHGNSTAGLTTTLPNPAAAITGGTSSVWAAIT